MTKPRLLDGTSPKVLLAREYSEADLQNAVIQYAKMNGWMCYHSRPGMMRSGRWSTPMQGHPGFPDLVLARKGQLILCELKSERGKVSEAQQEWLDVLGACMVEVYTWRPMDWLDGTIERVLR